MRCFYGCSKPPTSSPTRQTPASPASSFPGRALPFRSRSVKRIPQLKGFNGHADRRTRGPATTLLHEACHRHHAARGCREWTVAHPILMLWQESFRPIIALTADTRPLRTTRPQQPPSRSVRRRSRQVHHRRQSCSPCPGADLARGESIRLLEYPGEVACRGKVPARSDGAYAAVAVSGVR